MAHAVHFLSRLSRVSAEHTELALLLYRDPALVRSALAGAGLPEGAQDVAIALDERAPSPHLIVTRGGRFVTCLGRGMRPHGAVVLGRAALDRQCEGVEAYRAALARSRELDAEGPRVAALFRALGEGGPHLAREDFLALWGLQPLYADQLAHALLDLSAQVDRSLPLFERLRARGAPRLRGPDAAAVREAWNATHAVGHLSLLLGHPGDLFHLLPAFFDRAGLSWSWAAVKTDHAPVARQGLWLAAQGGIPALETCRQRLEASESTLHALDAAVGMAVIALKHPQLRAGAAAALEEKAARRATDLERRASPAAGNALQLFRVAEQLVEAPLDLEAIPLSPALRASLGPALALTGALSAQRPMTDLHSNHFAEFLLSAVALAKAQPEDFYFPRALLQAQPLPFDPRWALDTHRALHSLYLWPTTHRGGSPARPNAPCPCGSGLKHKRCCGRASPGQ